MPTTPQETRTRFDDDNDGRIDRIAFDNDGDGTADRIDHYTYDDDGARRVIRRDVDLDDDGTINRTAHLNADGRWERVDLDVDDDGAIDRINHYAFAADGTRSLTRTAFDTDGDGTADRSEAYTYNSGGTLIRTAFDDDGDGRIDRTAFDPDGDGTADRIDHYTYDDDGARRVTRRDVDLDDDGTINRTAHLNAEGRWERVDLDADDDGNIDRSDHYTFAADGTRSLTRTAFDDDGDGTADRSEAYTYNSGGTLIRTAFDDDADGRIDRTAFDPDGDGTADRSEAYSYDGDGTLIRTAFDDDADGTIDRTALDTDGDGTADRSEAYTYNESGTLIRTAFDDDADGRIDRTAFDPDGDGTADRIDHYTYDDGARRVIRRDVDLDDDGTINRTAHLNAEGRWERVDLDADDDGNIDRSDHYTFAADGTRSLTRTAFDTDGDGTADRSEAYTYNSDGTLIRTAFDDDADGRIDRTAFDTDGDGTADRSEAYTYNSGGTLIRTAFDDNNDATIDRTAFDPDSDGTADRIDHYTYDDDGARRVIRRDVDLDDDGNIDRTAHLNAEGRWERVDLDADDDGNIDRSDHYTFAADGTRSLTRTAFDTDGDGTADRSEAYTYNSDGTLIRTAFDDDADGRIDRTAFDPDGDGTADRIDHYTYDDDGARRVIRRDVDLDDDGTINRTAHLNAEGRWERVDLDADDDGNIDRSDHYTFAADGTRSLTRTAFDTDGDGTADRSEAYTYNESGTLIRTAFDDDADGRIDRTAFDPDGDGTADRIDHYTYDDDGARRVIRRDVDLDDDGTINRTTHLNAEGRWERVDLDADDDGNIDRSDHYTFAADGTRSLTRTAFDTDGDGTADRSEAYTYNSGGTLIRTAFDDDADGRIDRTAFDTDGDGTADRSEAYTYNSGGTLIRTAFDDNNDATIDRTAFDPDSDGTADRIDHYTYDDDGARRVIRRDVDLDDDGTINRTAHLNAEGRWERVDLDADDDGNIDRSDHYTFAADGTRSLTRTAFDTDGDGTADRSEAYTYNSDGTLIRTAFDDDADGRIDRTAFDPDGDGTADRIDHYTYDDDGARRVIRRDVDLDDDGTINRTAHLNAEGRWERVDLDADDDGNIDRSDHYTFAADGTRSLTRTAFDDDGDGTADRSEAYSYDDDGTRSLIRTAFDDDADGTTERTETYTYDGNGNLTRTDFDDDADGITDRAENYDLNGNLIRTEMDTDNDGFLDRTEIDLDGDGNPERVEARDTSGQLVRLESDDLSDGTPNRVEYYWYPEDLDGSRDEFRQDDDTDGDGDLDRVTYEGDADFAGEFPNHAGLEVVRLGFVGGGEGSTTLTIPDKFVFAGNPSGNQVRIEGGNTDMLNFDMDDFTEGDRSDVNGESYRSFTADDGSWSFLVDADVRLNAPTFTSPATVSVAENQAAAYEAAAVATDADGDSLSYSLSGTDAGLFTIDANTGEVRFMAAPDFEAPGDDDRDNVYDITVTASDGANSANHNVAITVTNENDNAPTFTSPATVSVAENQVATYEAAAAATDADGDSLRYSLSGTDAGLFTIDANTGEVRFRAAPDFEAPGDDDRDNVYDITVTASDGTNRTEQAVAITVTNENDNAPTFTSPATVSVAENQVATYEAAATDADGDSLRYSLSGTDAALFTIDANTGEVSFMAAPDFEAPGDDDRDNVYDITVTASDGTKQTDQSVAITVTNENDLISLSSLDGTTGFILNGIDARDYSGRSVSSAGDVNGDGYDDLIIGAYRADPNGDSSGETYVIYGGASAPGTEGELDLSTLDGTNGFILNGIDAFDHSGRSVSSAGDVNGDGYDDLIIGATGVGSLQGEYSTIPGPGEAYVVYGGPTGADLVLDRSTLDGTRGFALTGIDDGDDLGLSVSSAGDVNGDGYDDLILGAYEADPHGDSRAGETYIVYGGASAPGTEGELDLSTLDGTNGFILNGVDAGDLSGFSVSSAGDVNGDGYDDLIIGAWGADPNGDNSAGETYIVYGGANAPGTGGVLDLSDLDATNGFTLTGSARNNRVGFSVSSAGDVNGDGYDDLIIGADGTAAPDGGNLVGEIHVVYGGASAPGTDGVLDLSDLDGSNGFTLTGIDAYDRSGTSVSSAGDVNGDGYDDLILGAGLADPNGDSSAGETYVVYGGASAPGTGGRFNLSALDGTNGFILNGIDGSDYSGRSVSSAGDVNGDGYDDLIIGASGADPNGDREAGETYVIYGGATGTESLVPVTASGTAAAAAAADNFTGNAGADSFTDIATNDVVRGGAGDDTISVTALDFAAIDGGTGTDQLILDGAGLSLDLTGAGHAGVDSVEVFDLSGTGANTLVLDALAVFDLTEERAGGVASLDVRGDADDRVDLGGSNFARTGTVTEDGTTYNIYRDGNAQIRVEAGVQVQIPVSTLPTFTSPATVSVAENQVAAYEAAATDADGDSLSYSLSGTDAALFTIDANTGEVRFMAAPDFEMPGDDDRDNVYDITVTASDGTNSTNHNVAITVTNENDNAPTFTSPATVSVAENQVATYEAAAAATDADGDSLSYSLSGTDAALFTIDANTGEVRFRAAPDFEAPGDDDRDNVHDITVTASDDTNRTEQAVAITVTNENDNVPAFTSPATVSVAENQVAAYEAAAADADGDSLRYSLSGTDAALFTIDANTGEVSFRAAPDFEAPGDADRDNVHDITVTRVGWHQ